MFDSASNMLAYYQGQINFPSTNFMCVPGNTYAGMDQPWNWSQNFNYPSQAYNSSFEDNLFNNF